MYTNQQWIDMLKEVNTFASHYETFEAYYSKIDDKKRDIENNTGAFVTLVLFVVVIVAFIKFGWLKGLIVLVVAGILYDVYDKTVIKKKEMAFEEEYGEKMKELNIEMEVLKKQRSDMEKSESYLACKNNLPGEYMGSSWYHLLETARRSKIQKVLENGAETLEKAIELERRNNGFN